MKQRDPASIATDNERRLRAFEALLIEVALPAGLVAERDRSRLWERHVLDSTRAARCVPPEAGEAVDVGSGAGLPGIPLAIVRPDLRVSLIEPLARRVAFLELAIERLSLRNVLVVCGRAGEVAARRHVQPADVALARALGGPAASWDLAAPLLAPSGSLIYFAGASWDDGALEELRAIGVRATVCDQGEPPGVGPLVMMRPIGDPEWSGDGDE